jgi:uncharacterized FlaG/YvyC family protein
MIMDSIQSNQHIDQWIHELSRPKQGREGEFHPSEEHAATKEHSAVKESSSAAAVIRKQDPASTPVDHVQDTPENMEKIRKVVGVLEKINRIHPDARYRFQVNSDTGKIQVAVVNARTGEILEEIPSTRLLRLAADIEELSGFILEEKV